MPVLLSRRIARQQQTAARDQDGADTPADLAFSRTQTCTPPQRTTRSSRSTQQGLVVSRVCTNAGAGEETGQF